MIQRDYVDVLIVGAGISGIAAAVHLQNEAPDQTFAIVEGRDNVGGTWDLFRYPGIRSDSDMYTLGFGFKPWTEDKSIASGDAILNYLWETVKENGLTDRIRFNHQVKRAEWSSETDTWTVVVERAGEVVQLTCRFLFMCSGYYNYREGFTPGFEGRERFQGEIVHPQQWPADLDVQDKKVIVIGSGATAVTLIPNLAKTASKVTMVQRSPSYLAVDGDVDAVAVRLQKILGPKLAYKLIRLRNTRQQQKRYAAAQRDPEKFKEGLFSVVRDRVGQDYLDRHFTPTYNPWDQRLCLIPNGDMFDAIRDGRAAVATGRIESFTEDGLRLTSGEEISADIIVTATGLQLVTLGEIEFLVDGEPVDFSKRWTYKGLAYSGVPNLASVFGYVNTSWTVRAELVAQFVCRLLKHMSATGSTRVTPQLRDGDAQMATKPFVEGFASGYFQRANGVLPMQGDRAPWVNPQNHRATKRLLTAPVADGVLTFE